MLSGGHGGLSVCQQCVGPSPMVFVDGYLRFGGEQRLISKVTYQRIPAESRLRKPQYSRSLTPRAGACGLVVLQTFLLFFTDCHNPIIGLQTHIQVT